MRLEVVDKRMERGLLPMPPADEVDYTQEQELVKEI